MKSGSCERRTRAPTRPGPRTRGASHTALRRVEGERRGSELATVAGCAWQHGVALPLPDRMVERLGLRQGGWDRQGSAAGVSGWMGRRLPGGVCSTRHSGQRRTDTTPGGGERAHLQTSCTWSWSRSRPSWASLSMVGCRAGQGRAGRRGGVRELRGPSRLACPPRDRRAGGDGRARQQLRPDRVDLVGADANVVEAEVVKEAVDDDLGLVLQSGRGWRRKRRKGRER